uniref:Uncharacterized protein n=1 Tax=Knipowitschia caucasica TaxID=637954 RepID=A0AAV2L8H9_KNICA
MVGGLIMVFGLWGVEGGQVGVGGDCVGWGAWVLGWKVEVEGSDLVEKAEGGESGWEEERDSGGHGCRSECCSVLG